ncbi:Uridine phosphorylase 2 [Perkinsus olseni]|uniref:Uridine phosphorylase 2 n=1 Tax=Perkinsus olseni TaxID=32597 RepID=A0A7J6QU44_PEROL|nr:Uridine phosphorylase 2 [Perkinsus olseni]
MVSMSPTPKPSITPVAAAEFTPRSFESPTSERMAAFPKHLHTDYYYHLGLDTDMDLRGIFGDVKFVVLMGSAARAELLAEAVSNAIVSKGMPKPAVARLGKTERYTMYKVGPVIAVSHGMGGPSLHILMNELAKLCDRAGIIDSVKWIRMGTSGGCGVPPGTVVVTTQAMNEEVEPFWRCVQLGKVVKVPTDCVDMSFVDAILESVPEGINAVKGKTMAADDFYEGQGRLDGALETWYNEEDKMAFMKRLYDAGVRNIEMESVALMGFCNRANITAACVCVTLVDRFKGMAVTPDGGDTSESSTPPSSERMAAFPRKLKTDYYYHLGLDTDMDLHGIFGNVKFVVLMGSAARAEFFAEAMANAIVSKGMPKPAVARLGKTERYSMYKVGPVIAVSHGMGGPSLHILVNEIAKLCDRAGIIDSVKWIRMGTSGGCGVPPGTVVVTTQAMNEEVEPFWRCVQLGKVVKVPTDCVDMSFVDAILESVPEGINAVKGKTMAADDFYEGQGRLDGALETWYNEEDKMAFMKRLYDAGVRNIEMESVAMMGFCNRANITAACVCVTIVDRLEGDQITSTKRELSRFNEHSIDVVSNFIAGELKKSRGRPS